MPRRAGPQVSAPPTDRGEAPDHPGASSAAPIVRRRRPGPDAAFALVVAVLVGSVFSHVGATEDVSFDVQMLAILALAGLAAVSVARGGLHHRVPVGLGAVVIYVAVVAASVVWAYDRSAALGGFASLLKAVVVAFALAVLLDARRLLVAAVWGVLVSGGVIAGAALVNLAVPSFTVVGLTSGEEHGLLTADVFRPGGPVGDPNFFSQLLVVVVALGIERARHAPSPWARLAAGTVAVLAAAAIALSWSRGGLLALVVVAAMSLPRPDARMWPVAAIGVVVVLLLAPAAYVERFTATFDAIPGLGSGQTEDGAVRGRTSEVIVGIQQFSDHPVGGVGIGNYEELYLEYAVGVGLEQRREDRSAHSAPVEVLAETGLLGLVAWSGLLAVVFLGLAETRRRSVEAGAVDDARLARGLSVAMVGYLITALFLHGAQPRGFWLLVGLAVAAPVALRPVRRSVG